VSMLWIVVAAVGGCLVGIYLGVFGMCLFAASYNGDEQAVCVSRDVG